MNQYLDQAKKCLDTVDEALANAEQAPFFSGDAVEFATHQLEYARTCALIAIAEMLDRQQERPFTVLSVPPKKWWQR